jgi:K+/H+ antiporter YhaU regulatory subunit KhtT
VQEGAEEGAVMNYDRRLQSYIPNDNNNNNDIDNNSSKLEQTEAQTQAQVLAQAQAQAYSSQTHQQSTPQADSLEVPVAKAVKFTRMLQ